MSDTTRVMNRLKAMFRRQAIACGGHEVYRQERREVWLAKLTERGAKERARSLYRQLAALKALWYEAKLAMVREARRGAAYVWLMSVPRLGAVSVAQLLAVVGTRIAFELNDSSGATWDCAVVTSSTADMEVVEDVLRRSRRQWPHGA